jgi:4-amino-4-deoxy-L-arabinose transferase-like glycosyltransferase
VPKAGWLVGLSDPPASFLILLMVVLLLQAMDQGTEVGWKRMAGIGAAMGLAFTFRVHTALTIGFLLAYIWRVHGLRALGITCAAGVIAYIPQAWYNQAVFGLPLTVGYISYWDVQVPTFEGGTLGRPLSNLLASLPFHPRHLVDNLNYHLGRRPWLVIVALLSLAIGLYIIWRIRRKQGNRVLALVVGAPMAYLLPMMMTSPFRDDPIRFMMPVQAFLILIIVFVLDDLLRLLKRGPLEAAPVSVSSGANSKD